MTSSIKKLSDDQKQISDLQDSKDDKISELNSVNKINSIIDPWEKIVPFIGSNNLPDFPLEIFPGWLHDFIKAESIATQTPTDLAGMLVLSALGAILTKKAEIEIRQGWREQLNIWTITSLPPGNRKSAVFRAVIFSCKSPWLV